jgi:hypothetical protein
MKIHLEDEYKKKRNRISIRKNNLYKIKLDKRIKQTCSSLPIGKYFTNKSNWWNQVF